MTLRRAEFLTGYEIRQIPSNGAVVRLGAFEGSRLVAEFQHVEIRRALRRLVEIVYALHCRDVLQEYGWRCVRCGATRPLEIHHKRYRSQGGTHKKENLEPVCWDCHQSIHGQRAEARRAGGNNR